MVDIRSRVRFLSVVFISVAVAFSGGDASAASKKPDYLALYEYIWFVSLTSGYVGPGNWSPFPLLGADPQFKKGVTAYFWGLPLVEMRRTQQSVFNLYSLERNLILDSDVRNTGTSVVAPNLDVLNSTAFIDFSAPNLPPNKRAFVLSVPDTRQGEGGRGTFNIMQILDAYTNVQAAVGTGHPPEDDARNRNQGGNYLLAGPDYTDNIPTSLLDVIVKKIELPTNQAWLIGRTEVDAYVKCPLEEPGTDYEHLVQACVDAEAFDLSLCREIDEEGKCELQNGKIKSPGKSFEFASKFTLTPLDEFEDNLIPTEPQVNPRSEPAESNPNYDYPMFYPYLSDQDGPPETHKWEAEDFFEYLGASVEQNGITKPNKKIYGQFKSLGLKNTGYQKPKKSAVVTERDKGVYAASKFLAYLAKSIGETSGSDASSWTVNTSLGVYDSDPAGWFLATAVAAVGLGANSAEDGIYPLALQDSGGCPLDGSSDDYTLTFSAGSPPVADGGFPPVNTEVEGDDEHPLGFWSLTVYDLNGTIFASQAGNDFYGAPVYSLGSIQLENLTGEVVPSEDVMFLLQSEAPADEDLPFWLPVPDEEFEVILRIYAPDMDYFPIPYDCNDEDDDPNTDCTAPNKYVPPDLVPGTACAGEYSD